MESIQLMNVVIRGHISILEVQFLKESEIVKWNGGHKIFIFCSFLCLSSQPSATPVSSSGLLPSNLNIQSMNSISIRIMKWLINHCSRTFMSIHELFQVISIKNDIFTNVGSKFWTSNGSKMSLFGIKTGLLSESLSYAEFDNFFSEFTIFVN